MSQKFTDLVDVLQQAVATRPRANLFGSKIDDSWTWITYAEFGRRVEHMRGGLASIGIGPGDTVGMIANNRVEWAVAAYATYGLGARYCPMYENQLDDDRKYIIEDSGSKVVIAATYAIYETTREWIGSVGELEHVYCMALPREDEDSFLALEARGENAPAPVATIDPESVCGFIYTSGTTGKPKGVLLSHRNIVSNLNAVADILPVDERDVSLSFLPWAHSFGQTCELHLMISAGAAMAINDAVENLVPNLADVRPTVLFSVPRVFNRIYDGLQKKIAEDGGLKKTLFDKGIAVAGKRKDLEAQGRSSGLLDLQYRFFDKVVFSKVRERFGGRLRYAVSGGAALSREVGEFIDRLGIYVCEGYGLTETSPIVSTNYPGTRKIGSVGKPIEGVTVKIDTAAVGENSTDGEIVVYGPNVMMGYHNLPDKTAEVMTDDGGFRTGDLGRLDDDNFLYITGRLKEQYKLENGKYVVPAPLEELLQLSGFISQAFIYGDNKPYNGALIIPDQAALEGWAKQKGIKADYASLLEHADVRSHIEREIAEHSDGFKNYERIRRFKLIAEEFTVDNGLLTPKMSVKRRSVIELYQDELAALHADG
ncbi:MAG: long-chain fatty acid--CoA ligase [Acidobacteriota bacterium]